MDNPFAFFHDFIIWGLVCFGVSFGITHSKIFSKVRQLASKINNTVGYFFQCPMCMGFWVGIGLGWLWISPTGLIFLDGFLGLAITWLLYCVSWKLALQDPNV